MSQQKQKLNHNPYPVGHHLRHIHGDLQCFFCSMLDCLWSVSDSIYGENRKFIDNYGFNTFLRNIEGLIQSKKDYYIDYLVLWWPGEIRYDKFVDVYDAQGNVKKDSKGKTVQMIISNFMLRSLNLKGNLEIKGNHVDIFRQANGFIFSSRESIGTFDLGFEQGDCQEALQSALHEVFGANPKRKGNPDDILHDLCSYIHCRVIICKCKGIAGVHDFIRSRSLITSDISDSIHVEPTIYICTQCKEYLQIFDIHETLPEIFFVNKRHYAGRNGKDPRTTALLEDFDFQTDWTKSDIGRITTGFLRFNEKDEVEVVQGNTERYRVMALSCHTGKSVGATKGHYQTLCRNKDFDRKGELGSWLDISDGKVVNTFTTYQEGFEHCFLKHDGGQHICSLAVYQRVTKKGDLTVSNEIANGMMSKFIKDEFEASKDSVKRAFWTPISVDINGWNPDTKEYKNKEREIKVGPFVNPYGKEEEKFAQTEKEVQERRAAAMQGIKNGISAGCMKTVLVAHGHKLENLAFIDQMVATK